MRDSVCAADLDAPLADAAEKRGCRNRSAICSSRRADVNAAQADGMTALHWAVYHDDLQTGEATDRRAAPMRRPRIATASRRCRWPAPTAIGIVELLLDAGADPNTTLPGGETALMTAARTGVLGPVEVAARPRRRRERQGTQGTNGPDVGRGRRACRSRR